MSAPIRVLVVDDEPTMLRAFRRLLPALDFALETADSGAAALPLLGRPFDVIAVDLMLPDLSGLELLRRVQAEAAGTPVIVMTAYGSVATAVAALKAGAVDFLTKPFAHPGQVVEALRQAAAQRRQGDRASAPVAPAEGGGPFEELVGGSPKMRELFSLVQTVARSRASVLILGESGTGKELVARAIHKRSGRRGAFVAVSCSALPETLLETELFGHARGAFTGAISAKKGLFEAADGGTLLLDEIGEITPPVQVKLLRAIQEGEVRPVGQVESVRVDVRVLSATHVDLHQAMATAAFREDLYYRLAVITLQVPPLRERPEDIAPLARHFLRQSAERTGRQIEHIDEEVLCRLRAHPWPGNVRELENVLERAAVLCLDPVITVADLPPALRAPVATSPAEPPYMQLDFRRGREAALMTFERTYLSALLRRTGGNLSESARLAGLDRSNLRRVLRRCGVTPESFRPNS